jgi:hypothetical protein
MIVEESYPLLARKRSKYPGPLSSNHHDSRPSWPADDGHIGCRFPGDGPEAPNHQTGYGLTGTGGKLLSVG